MPKKYLLSLILALIIFPSAILAVVESGTGSNITAEINPRDPAPGSTVSITLSGYGFDDNRAYYEWSQNDSIKKSGTGLKKFSFQLGSIGQPTRIKASVFYNNRRLAEKSFYFEPADIQFDWQAKTLTPPFYRGKARATAGADIKVVATPYITNQLGQTEKVENLNYNWYINDILNDTVSGRGHNIVSISTDPRDTQLKISLKVTNADSSSNASKSLLIYLNKPELAFYEQKPLEGVNYRNQVIDNFDLYDEEVTFIAVPFFWPLKYLASVNYNWTVNNLSTQNKDRPNSLTVRQPGEGVGVNQVSLRVTNIENNLSPISKYFNIKFGNNLLKSYDVD